MFSVKPQAGDYAICQDDAALRTPKGRLFAVPKKDLAEAIAREFEESSKDIRKMPLAQLALTAIDISADRREDVINGIMSFGDHELICQRASHPPELVREQEKLWQPYLEWCRAAYNAELRTGSGVAPFEQSAHALRRLRDGIGKRGAFFLTGLSQACAVLGSLVIGLAFMEGRVGASEALEAAEMESLWQNRKWGKDACHQSRYAEMLRELKVCDKWFSLLRI